MGNAGSSAVDGTSTLTSDEVRVLREIHRLAAPDQNGKFVGQEMVDLVDAIEKHTPALRDQARLRRFSLQVVVDSAELVKSLSELEWWNAEDEEDECWVGTEKRQRTLEAVLAELRQRKRARADYACPYTLDVPDPRQYAEMELERESSETSEEASDESSESSIVRFAHRIASSASLLSGGQTSVSEESVADASAVMWKVMIVGDDFASEKHCDADGNLKPCRPIPHVRASAFFGALRRDAASRAWIYPGEINEWPGLTSLELVSITTWGRRRARKLFKKSVRTFWDTHSAGDTPPSFPPPKPQIKTVIAEMRAPRWALRGWSEARPGAVFWFAPFFTPLSEGAPADAPLAALAATSSSSASSDKTPPPVLLAGAVTTAEAAAADVIATRRASLCIPSFFIGNCAELGRGTHSAAARAVRVSHFAHRYAKGEFIL